MFNRKKKIIIEMLNRIQAQNNYLATRINKVEDNVKAEIGRLEDIICDTTWSRENDEAENN